MPLKIKYQVDDLEKFCEDRFNKLKRDCDALLMFHNIYGSAFPRPFIASSEQQAEIDRLEKEFEAKMTPGG